jgi:type I restriction enzyme S subunit
VTLNKENNLTYFGEVLKSMDLNRYSQSAAQPGLAVDTIMDLSVPVPPFKEQNQIAKFIEVQTSKLERIVEKDKLLIKLLKAKRTSLINQAVTRGLDPDVEKKDSGIDWFGRIPKNWLIRRLKHIADVRISNIDKKSKQNEPDVLLCNYLDVYKNEFITSKLNFMKATASPEQIRKLTLHKSDVLITKDSEEPDDIAIPALVTEDLKGVVSGYHLALITPDSNYVTGAYLFRSLQSKKINDQFVVEANGVTRFGISTYPILNSYFLLPPIHEQIRITVHLDSETKRISKTIKRIRTQIDLLEEYKKSLINNAVTGKIDVREQKWT